MNSKGEEVDDMDCYVAAGHLFSYLIRSILPDTATEPSRLDWLVTLKAGHTLFIHQ
jgi:hypothetical protein